MALCGIRFITHFENVRPSIFTSEIAASVGSCRNNQVKSQWYLVAILSTDNTQDAGGVQGRGRRSKRTANSHSTANGKRGRKIKDLSPRTPLRRGIANPTDVNNLALEVAQKTHIPLKLLETQT